MVKMNSSAAINGENLLYLFPSRRRVIITNTPIALNIFIIILITVFSRPSTVPI